MRKDTWGLVTAVVMAGMCLSGCGPSSSTSEPDGLVSASSPAVQGTQAEVTEEPLQVPGYPTDIAGGRCTTTLMLPEEWTLDGSFVVRVGNTSPMPRMFVHTGVFTNINTIAGAMAGNMDVINSPRSGWDSHTEPQLLKVDGYDAYSFEGVVTDPDPLFGTYKAGTVFVGLPGQCGVTLQTSVALDDRASQEALLSIAKLAKITPK